MSSKKTSGEKNTVAANPTIETARQYAMKVVRDPNASDKRRDEMAKLLVIIETRMKMMYETLAARPSPIFGK